jgi:hypothetical protein
MQHKFKTKKFESKILKHNLTFGLVVELYLELISVYSLIIWTSFSLLPVIFFFRLSPCNVKIMSFISLMQYVDLRFHISDDINDEILS